MKQALTITSIIDTDFLIRSALDRIHLLEAEIMNLRQQQPVGEKCIWVHQGPNQIKVLLSEIFYIQSESNYSRIFTKSGQQYYMSRTLKSWMQEISESDFLRCHRSFLVNKKEIIEIKRSAYHIKLRNGQIIPVSRRKQNHDVIEISRTNDPVNNTRCKVHKLTPNPNTKFELAQNAE